MMDLNSFQPIPAPNSYYNYYENYSSNDTPYPSPIPQLSQPHSYYRYPEQSTFPTILASPPEVIYHSPETYSPSSTAYKSFDEPSIGTTWSFFRDNVAIILLSAILLKIFFIKKIVWIVGIVCFFVYALPVIKPYFWKKSEPYRSLDDHGKYLLIKV